MQSQAERNAGEKLTKGGVKLKEIYSPIHFAEGAILRAPADRGIRIIVPSEWTCVGGYRKGNVC